MMHKHIFSIFDGKAQAFLDPFLAVNSAVAVRMLKAAVNDERHDFGKFPEDYTLFRLGEFDSEIGKFKLLDTAEPVTKAIQLKEVK